MIQQLINTVQGNVNVDWLFTVTDSDNVPVNLTGATVTFHAQLASDPEVWFIGAMAVVDAPTGECKYSVQAGNLDIPGTYNCQIQASFLNGTQIISFDGIQVVVAPRIPTPEP